MELLPVEIFSTGRWANREWTERDLDQLVANFGALRDHVKPPVKLGHAERQVLAQRDGQPALGWVRELAKRGNKLVAMLADVPDVLKRAIHAGRYRRLSAEFFTNWEDTHAEETLRSGVKGLVLGAVSLLGADMPEVKNLGDLQVLLAEGVQFTEGAAEAGTVAVEGDLAATSAHASGDGLPYGEVLGRLGDRTIVRMQPGGALVELVPWMPPQVLAPEARATQNDGDAVSKTAAEETRMDEEKVRELIASETAKVREELTAKFDAEKAAKDAEIQRLTAQLDASRGREEAAARAARAAEADRFIAQHASAECLKLTDGMKPAVRALLVGLGDGEVVSAGDRKVLFSEDAEAGLSGPELVRRMVEAMPDQKHLVTRMTSAPAVPAAGDFDAAVTTVAKRENLDLSDREQRMRATRLASLERPDLASQYGRPRA